MSNNSNNFDRLDQLVGAILQEDPANISAMELGQNQREKQRAQQYARSKTAARLLIQKDNWKLAKEMLNDTLKLVIQGSERDTIENSIVLIDIIQEEVESGRSPKRLKESLLIYLEGNYDSGALLDVLLEYRTLAQAPKRLQALIHQLVITTGRHILREDLNALLVQLGSEIEALKRDSGSSKEKILRTLRKQFQTLKVSVESLPTFTVADLNEQIAGYEDLQRELDLILHRQLDLSAQTRQTLSQVHSEVGELLAQFKEGHEAAITCGWQSAVDAFFFCYQLDPDNGFFKDQADLLQVLKSVDQSFKEALQLPANERQTKLRQVTVRLDGLNSKYPRHPYIQAEAKRVSEYSRINVDQGYTILASGGVEEVEKFLGDARARISLPELDALDYLIKSIKQLYHREFMPDSNGTEQTYLDKAEEYARLSQSISPNRPEPDLVHRVIESYRALSLSDLTQWLTSANQLVVDLRNEASTIHLASFLAERLENGVVSVRQCNARLIETNSAADRGDFEHARDLAVTLRKTIFYRLATAPNLDLIDTWIRSLDQITQALAVLKAGEYKRASELLTTAQDSYPYQFSGNQDGLKAMLQQAKSAAGAPRQLAALSQKLATADASDRGSKLLYEVQESLKQMADREKIYVDRYYANSSVVLHNYLLILETIKQQDWEAFGKRISELERIAPRDPFLPAYRDLLRNWRAVREIQEVVASESRATAVASDGVKVEKPLPLEPITRPIKIARPDTQPLSEPQVTTAHTRRSSSTTQIPEVESPSWWRNRILLIVAPIIICLVCLLLANFLRIGPDL